MATVIDSLLIELGIDASKFNSEQKKIVADLKKISEEAEKTANAEVESSKKAEDATKKTGAEKKKSATEDKKTTVEKKKASEEENKAGKQSDKIAKETHVNTKKTADGFDKAKNAIMGFGTAFLGLEGIKALNAMISETAKNSAELGRQSIILGVPSEQLQSWGALAKAVGGSEEDVIGSLQSIQSALTDFATWGGSQGAIVSASILGLDTKDIDKFDIVAEKVKKYIEDTKDKMPGGETAAIQRAKMFTGQFGYNESTFKLLLLGGDALKELNEEYKKIGHVTPELIALSTQYTKANATLSQSFAGVKNVLTEGMFPALITLTDLLSKGLKAYANYAQYFHNIPFVKAIKKQIFGEETDVVPNANTGAGGPITNTDALFASIEKENGLPPGTMKMVRQIESGGNNNAVSSAGAKGPFQMTDPTAAAYGAGGADVFDVTKAGRASGKFLGHLLKKYHSMDQALAGYNMGEPNLDKVLSGKMGMPSETQGYLNKAHNYIGSSATVSNPMGNSSSNTQVTVNGVTVNTKATDGNGIARDLGQGIVDNSMIYNGVGGTLK
jgi:soluble lytic murein transglycosylase-like protein